MKIILLLTFSIVNLFAWINVSASECKAGGGKMVNGECKGTWETANRICIQKGYSLPYLFELMIAKEDKYDSKKFNEHEYWSLNKNKIYDKQKGKYVDGDAYWVQIFSKRYRGVYPLADYFEAYIKCTDLYQYNNTAFFPRK